MLINHAHKKTSRRHRGWLYSIVFASRISTMAILLLFVSFLIQPFHKAFASEMLAEVVVEPELIVPDDVSVQADTLLPIPEESPPEDQVDVKEDQPPVSTTDGYSSLNEDDGFNELASNTPQIVSPITNVEGEDTIVSEEIPISADFNSTLSGEFSTTTISEEAVATSTTETIIQAQYLVTEENFYQFSKQSCVAVGEGTYHCTRGGKNEIDSNSVVYSDIGATGNMEIYLKTTSGKVKQLTDNAYDDTSPFYDVESMRVVWQRLIDGRQQIILYDIKANQEQQLTFSRSNNMEPKVSNAGIVWQAWDEHDWEIMYFDGSYTDQITENDAHDVAPVIKDNYILWSVLGGDEHQARVYSLDTKETISIIGHEGGSIQNPRFVLVYDTKFDNGDVITQGFDPQTGLSNPIAASPVQEPVDIPNSDSTGETRALIQNKSSQKDENDFARIDNNPDPNLGPASTTDPAILDLSVGGEAESSDTDSSSDEPFSLTEYDLVLPL